MYKKANGLPDGREKTEDVGFERWDSEGEPSSMFESKSSRVRNNLQTEPEVIQLNVVPVTDLGDRVDGSHCTVIYQTALLLYAIHVLLTHLVSDHVLHGDLSADDVLVAQVPDGATKPRLEERGRQREEGPPRVGVRVHAVVPRGQAAHVHVGGEVALSNRVPQGGRLQFRDDGGSVSGHLKRFENLMLGRTDDFDV